MALTTEELDKRLFGDNRDDWPAAIRARYTPPKGQENQLRDAHGAIPPRPKDGHPDRRIGEFGLEVPHYSKEDLAIATRRHREESRALYEQGKGRFNVGRDGTLEDLHTLSGRDFDGSVRSHAPVPGRVGSAHPHGASARERAAPQQARSADPRDAPPATEAAGKAETFNKTAAKKVDPGVITQEAFKKFQLALNDKLPDGQQIDPDGKTGPFARDALRLVLTQDTGHAFLKTLLSDEGMVASIQWLIATDLGKGISLGNVDGDYGAKTKAGLEQWMGDGYTAPPPPTAAPAGPAPR